MTRLTFRLEDELAERLHREARRLGTSVSEIIRTSVEQQRFGNSSKATSLPFVALGRSGTKHTARNAKAILRKELAIDRNR
jgi:predicted transcriptional regulator